MVTLEIGNINTKINGYIGKEHFTPLKKAIGYLDENFYWKIKNTKSNWDGWVSCLKSTKKGLYFSSGVLSEVSKYFKDNHIDFRLKDLRVKPEKNLDLSMDYSIIEDRDYQTDCRDRIDKSSRGILQIATGGGKTCIASHIVSRINVSPAIFYVPQIDLLIQAKEELEKFILNNSKKLNGRKLEVGMIGGGYIDIKDINIMTMQTALRALDEKYDKFDEEDNEKDKTDLGKRKEDIKKLIKNAKLIIFDECQHCASSTCQKICKHSTKAYYRVAMSATPYRDMNDDILITACFGKIQKKVSASKLIRENVLVKPDIYMVPFHHENDASSYQSVYKECIVENTLRNMQISKWANKLADKNRKILTLCRQLNHVKVLNDLMGDRSYCLSGKDSKDKRRDHLEKMRSGEIPITISTNIFDEGIDVKPLDTLILAGSGKSATRALQRIGRVIRSYPGKKNAVVIDFIDHCKYLKDHSLRRKKIYETEPEFNIELL